MGEGDCVVKDTLGTLTVVVKEHVMGADPDRVRDGDWGDRVTETVMVPLTVGVPDRVRVWLGVRVGASVTVGETVVVLGRGVST